MGPGKRDREGVRSHASPDSTLVAAGPVEESAKAAASAWMAELAEGLGFDLPDAFARDREVLTDFFERVLGAVFQAESHLDHAFFSRGQRVDYLVGHFLEIAVNNRIARRDDASILDEITQMRIFFLANSSFQRNRLLGDLQHLAYL